MLRFLKTYETKDFVRDLQLNFNYGIQICPNNRSVQWHGAYADSEGTVSAFTARKVASSGEVEKYYELDTDCVLYANGQYYYDPESFYGDGVLPEGFYYLEFSDGIDTYYSELFCVKELVNQFLASGDWLASGSFLVSQITIENPITTLTGNGMVLIPIDFLQDYQIITSALTANFDTSISENAKITLGHNCVLTLTNLVNGREGNIIVIQGASDYTLTLIPTPYVINDGGGDVSIASGSGVITVLSYSYDGTNLYVNYGQTYSNT